jgi:peroxiredoxin
MKKAVVALIVIASFGIPGRAQSPKPVSAESRVLAYVREHLQPGQPLIVSDLYNNVFTQPDERRALDKLFNAFFRIPLFVAQYQEKFGAPPSLQVIAQQFALESPQDAEVLLRVMESDPRVPKFLTRDSSSGEITAVDVEAIRRDARFGQVVERQLGGWEGKTAPAFTLPGIGGPAVSSESLHDKQVLLYVWFTGCPPCMKQAPELVKLDLELRGRGLVIIGANADQVLNLGYEDGVRLKYLKDHSINFPQGQWTRESDAAFGHISIFPTLFLVDSEGIILHHWVGYTDPEQLRRAILPGLAATSASGTPGNASD